MKKLIIATFATVFTLSVSAMGGNQEPQKTEQTTPVLKKGCCSQDGKGKKSCGKSEGKKCCKKNVKKSSKKSTK